MPSPFFLRFIGRVVSLAMKDPVTLRSAKATLVAAGVAIGSIFGGHHSPSHPEPPVKPPVQQPVPPRKPQQPPEGALLEAGYLLPTEAATTNTQNGGGK